MRSLESPGFSPRENVNTSPAQADSPQSHEGTMMPEQNGTSLRWAKNGERR